MDLVPLIESLDDNIDDLEEALKPLLQGALADTAGKLPLLDKAELYALVTYAIESIVFSYLRLNGDNPKEHPVFQELTRVKHYFEKIKAAESAGTKHNMTLDKAAAGRFIKHALSGNENVDLRRGRQSGKEYTATHSRFEENPARPIRNDSRKGSRAHPSSTDYDADPMYIGPSSKMMGGQSSGYKSESDNRTLRRRSMD